MDTTFWLVALPLEGGSAENTWNTLQQKTSRGRVPVPTPSARPTCHVGSNTPRDLPLQWEVLLSSCRENIGVCLFASIVRFALVALSLIEKLGHRKGFSSRLELCVERPSTKRTILFNLPELRVGTLDSLLALSDDLVKVSSLVAGTTQKIRRHIMESASAEGENEVNAELVVDGISAERFLTAFTWDEAKHPARRPLRETMERLQESVAKIEDDFRVKTGDLASAKTQLGALSRKAAGSLATRDLGEIVQDSDLVNTENLTTLCVAVPKYNQKEWLDTYETLAQFVVPRSSKLINEDGEYALYTVTLFRRVVDAFNTAARENSFQVREFSLDTEAVQAKIAERNDLERDIKERRTSMYQWCQTSYGEAFGAWVHVCAIRLFVESILRYGLPPSFQACVMKPQKRSEKKLRGILANTFGQGASSHWSNSDDDKGEEAFPYVSFSIEI